MLLLDEPTEGLDATTAGRLIERLRVTVPATTVVVATHDPGVIAAADDVIELG